MDCCEPLESIHKFLSFMVHFHTKKELATVDLISLALHLWSENN